MKKKIKKVILFYLLLLCTILYITEAIYFNTATVYATELPIIKKSTLGILKYLIADNNEVGNCLYSIKQLPIKNQIFIPTGLDTYEKADGIIFDYINNEIVTTIQMKNYNNNINVTNSNFINYIKKTWGWSTKSNLVLIDSIYNNELLNITNEISKNVIIHNSNNLVATEHTINILKEKINENNTIFKQVFACELVNKIEAANSNTYFRDLYDNYSIHDLKIMKKKDISGAGQHLYYRKALNNIVSDYFKNI